MEVIIRANTALEIFSSICQFESTTRSPLLFAVSAPPSLPVWLPLRLSFMYPSSIQVHILVYCKLHPPPLFRSLSSSSSLQRHSTENSKQIFPENVGLSPNFHIYVSVSDWYIPRIGLPILLQKNMWMRSSLVVRASDCQCTSCNGPGFDPSIRRHSGIWGAADEAVLNTVQKNPPPPKKMWTYSGNI